MSFSKLSILALFTSTWGYSQIQEIMSDINLSHRDSKYISESYGQGIFQNNESENLELWISDGVPTGNQSIKDIIPTGSSTPIGVIEMNRKFYFIVQGSEQNELWVTDRTSIGTYHLKDINPTGYGSPINFCVLNDLLYFSANDGMNRNEIWVTDGTESGTQMIKDFNPRYDSDPSGLYRLRGNQYYNVVATSILIDLSVAVTYVKNNIKKNKKRKKINIIQMIRLIIQ